MTNTITPDNILILSGEGYNLKITSDAAENKARLLAGSSTVTAVTSADESSEAQRHVRSLAAVRIAVEKARKEIKAPVVAIGKLIDNTAKTYLAELEKEEKRISGLVADHAAAVERERKQKEAEARQALAEAAAARAAAEAAEAKAESRNIADVVASKHAEAERIAAGQNALAANDALAATRVNDGIRFAWDFEVEDIDKLYKAAPALVTTTPKRAEILARLNQAAEANDEDFVIAQAAEIGIIAVKKPVVGTR